MDTTVRRHGDVAVVEIPGRLVYGDGQGTIRAAVDRLLTEGTVKIVLDMDRVPYMDSSGLVELVGCHKRIVQAGGLLRLARVNQKIGELLTITKLNRVMESYDELEKAIAGFPA